MKTINFDKLYTDFQKFFTICHYNNEALKEEILKRFNELEQQSDVLLFSFRQVIFKFQIDNNSIKYIGYEK
jgi:hypothetical protein